MGLPWPLQGHHSSSTLMCPPTEELSEPCPFGFFRGFLTYSGFDKSIDTGDRVNPSHSFHFWSPLAFLPADMRAPHRLEDPGVPQDDLIPQSPHPVLSARSEERMGCVTGEEVATGSHKV